MGKKKKISNKEIIKILEEENRDLQQTVKVQRSTIEMLEEKYTKRTEALYTMHSQKMCIGDRLQDLVNGLRKL